MYSRSTHRGQRFYNPPPGYSGSTFTGKHHPPEQELERDEGPVSSTSQAFHLEKEESGDSREIFSPREKVDQALCEMHTEKSAEKSPIHALLESLQGKIGEEELIILLVLLMVSSEGLCAEGLILALVLLAGRSS